MIEASPKIRQPNRKGARQRKLPAQYRMGSEPTVDETIAELRQELAEAQETLAAIRDGHVDAVIVKGRHGEQVYSLAETENIYRLMVENICEPALVVGRKNTIVFFNGRLSELTGLHSERIAGKRVLEVFAPADRGKIRRLLSHASSPSSAGVRAELRAVGGPNVPVYWRANLIRHRDGPLVCLLGTDLTQLEGSAETIQFLKDQRQAVMDTQHELELSRQHYADLFDLAPVGFLNLTPHGSIRDVNMTGAEMLGRYREHLIGRPLVTLVVRSDRAKLLRHLRLVQKDQKTREEVRVELPRGGTIALELVSTLTLGSLISTAQINSAMVDITERKRDEERQANLAAIVESSSDPIVGKTLDGIILSWNPAAEELFGYSAEEMIGQSILKIIPKERASEETMILEKLRAGQRIDHYETERVTRSGRHVPVSLTISPVRDSAGNIIAASKIMHDITERKHAEEQLRRSRDLLERRVAQRTAELRMANEELQRALASERRLETEVIAISNREQQRIGQDLHDGLTQLLTGISHLSYSLEQSLAGNSPTDAHVATRINELVRRAVDDARALARGLCPVKADPYGLDLALEDFTTQICDTHGIACRFMSRERLAVADSFVATHLYRIAQEAVHNAIRHGRAKHVTIQLEQNSDALSLTIQDDGVGVPKTSGNIELGLGQQIMRYRANACGGSLAIRNARPHGVIVACTIPLRKLNAVHAQANRSSKEKRDANPAR